MLALCRGARRAAARVGGVDMNKRAIKYRDTHAAPGSELFEALEAGDMARADSIYRKCDAEMKLREGRLAYVPCDYSKDDLIRYMPK